MVFGLIICVLFRNISELQILSRQHGFFQSYRSGTYLNRKKIDGKNLIFSELSNLLLQK